MNIFVNAMLLILTFAMCEASTRYFEAALVIGVLGIVATAALAKLLMRGKAIQ
jgi:multicomponent K+:H+ antiporter subunit F